MQFIFTQSRPGVGQGLMPKGHLAIIRTSGDPVSVRLYWITVTIFKPNITTHLLLWMQSTISHHFAGNGSVLYKFTWIYYKADVHQNSRLQNFRARQQIFSPSGEQPNNVCWLLSKITNCRLYSNIDKYCCYIKYGGIKTNLILWNPWGYITDMSKWHGVGVWSMD